VVSQVPEGSGPSTVGWRRGAEGRPSTIASARGERYRPLWQRECHTLPGPMGVAGIAGGSDRGRDRMTKGTARAIFLSHHSSGGTHTHTHTLSASRIHQDALTKTQLVVVWGVTRIFGGPLASSRWGGDPPPARTRPASPTEKSTRASTVTTPAGTAPQGARSGGHEPGVCGSTWWVGPLAAAPTSSIQTTGQNKNKIEDTRSGPAHARRAQVSRHLGGLSKKACPGDSQETSDTPIPLSSDRIRTQSHVWDQGGGGQGDHQEGGAAVQGVGVRPSG